MQPLTAQQVGKILLKNGFELKHTRGSHRVYVSSSPRRMIVVPYHGSRPLKRETFWNIVKASSLDKKHFK